MLSHWVHQAQESVKCEFPSEVQLLSLYLNGFQVLVGVGASVRGVDARYGTKSNLVFSNRAPERVVSILDTGHKLDGRLRSPLGHASELAERADHMSGSIVLSFLS